VGNSDEPAKKRSEKAMVRKLVEENANDVIANFDEPSDNTELGIQVRVMAPKDIVCELQKLLAQHGFTPAGSRPERGLPDRERSYMIAPLKQFRQMHGLMDLDVSDADAKAELEIVEADKVLPQLRKDQALLQSKLGETQKELGRCAEDPLRRIELKDHQQKLVNEIHLLNQSIDDKQRITNRRPGLKERKKRFAIMRDMIAHPPQCENCGAATRLRSPPDWLRQSLETLTPNHEWSLSFACTDNPLRCGHSTRVFFPAHEKTKPRRKSVTDGYLPSSGVA
jgi:hypothetical protein